MPYVVPAGDLGSALQLEYFFRVTFSSVPRL
jgi:hypothetical protein